MSQPPLSPTQPDLSPGSPKKRKHIDEVVIADDSSSDEEEASKAPLTQATPARTKGCGPGPHTRRYYSREEIESELFSIQELLKGINEHIENLEKFLKLH